MQNVIDLNLDGLPDIIEPYFMTGADGNYYFDLPYCTELPDGTYETYTIRQEPPPETTLHVDHPLFSDSYSVTLLPDDPATPELEHRNWAVSPAWCLSIRTATEYSIPELNAGPMVLPYS